MKSDKTACLMLIRMLNEIWISTVKKSNLVTSQILYLFIINDVAFHRPYSGRMLALPRCAQTYS